MTDAVDARTLGDRVAHAATPWDWRRRWAVVALVVVGVALLVSGVALGIARGDGVANRVVLVAANVVPVWFLIAWPAIRALRRRRAAGARSVRG